MGVDTKQLRIYVVRPALTSINLWTQDAEDLVMGTGMQESRFVYLKQVVGPALGLWQMEPNTYNDIWRNFILNKPSLASSLSTVTLMSPGQIPPPDTMTWNLRFAAAMCRIHYYRTPAPVPKDAMEAAVTYKKYYNGPGAATVEGAMPFFKQAYGEHP
jgi:hypothetical protein